MYKKKYIVRTFEDLEVLVNIKGVTEYGSDGVSGS